MTLSEEGVPEHGKLWCLVHHMRKVLRPWKEEQGNLFFVLRCKGCQCKCPSGFGLSRIRSSEALRACSQLGMVTTTAGGGGTNCPIIRG